MSLTDGAKLFADLEAQFAAKSFADATQTVTNLKVRFLAARAPSFRPMIPSPHPYYSCCC